MINKIDIKRITDGVIHIQGWALPKNQYDNVEFFVYNKNEICDNIKITRVKREDVADIYLKNYNGDAFFGYHIEIFDSKEDFNYKLVIKTKNEKCIEYINKKEIYKFNSFNNKRKELIISYINLNTIKRAIDFLFKEGIFQFIIKFKRKLKGLYVDYDYSEWYKLTCKTKEELENEKKFVFKFNPLFSIIIPIYDTSDQFLELLFDSIFNQTYQNYEICIADATNYSNCVNNPKKFIENKLYNKLLKNNMEKLYDRIKINYLNNNKSIADNTNEAIKLAKGDYIVLCDHDDELTYDALFEINKAINDNINIELIYSDEDKIDTKSEDYFEPAFKSDFNLDMLLSVNYFCHLTTIKKSLLDSLYENDKVYLRNEYDGAQDYDLFLRLVNSIINKSFSDGKYDTDKIYHIKKVLYHWRSHKKSTSNNVESKNYAFLNGMKAVENFYKITKINFPPIEKVEKGFDYGLYHTIYKKEDEPLISVIIPNKDHIDDLNLTITSLLDGNYKNLEFIICENNSVDTATFEYYDKLEKNNDINVKIVKYDGKFNYSKINNYATTYASSDYILYLNNDVEMIDKNSIFEMLSYIKRDDVGAVGAKLLYKDNTIQHAGVVLGFGGAAGHTFIGVHNLDHSYMNRAHIVQDYNAVTAACLMTKKSIFDTVGGFDEKLEVAFNDIDFCLSIRNNNKLIVYNPYSLFYHYESKTRGYEDNDEKVKRFNKETAYLIKKWNKKITSIDEYYNPNLTLRKSDFSLRNLKFEKIGTPFPLPTEIINIMKSYE